MRPPSWETANARASELVRAIHDGSLGLPTPETLPASGITPGEAAAQLRALVRPDPARARALSRILESDGSFTPRRCWPELDLVGCWLGGSAGLHARRLEQVLGPGVPLRDLGFLASEGRFTVPVDDSTAAGPLAVHTSFFEFIPEEAIDDPRPPVLLAHEVEDGHRYHVILSGGNGLYRYDINDVVEVEGFCGRTPRIRFLRKGRDMVSITGEKLHLNHIQSAIRAAEAEAGLEVWQFRVIPDVPALRYDLLVECRERPADGEARGRTFVRAFDRALSSANVEYASKRKSRRLSLPHLFLMRPGWAERLCRADFRAGKREAQYKWPAIRESWDEASRAEVATVVREREDAPAAGVA
jgi:hypothetical protein